MEKNSTFRKWTNQSNLYKILFRRNYLNGVSCSANYCKKIKFVCLILIIMIPILNNSNKKFRRKKSEKKK